MLPPHPEPPLWAWLLFGAFEFAIRVVALGVVPKHRRASTSTAWLLLIFLWPLLGVPLYFIFGSWWAMGRRLDDDPEASQLVDAIVAGSTALPRVCPHHEERAVPRMSPHARAAAPPR